jgi:hypothetical protein
LKWVLLGNKEGKFMTIADQLKRWFAPMLLVLTAAAIGGCAQQPKPATQPAAKLQQPANVQQKTDVTQGTQPQQGIAAPKPAIAIESSRAPWTMHFVAQGNQPLVNLTVPHGKVLVIEYISARYLHEAAVAFPSVNYRLSIDDSNYYFPVQGQGQPNGGPFMEFTGQTRIYALPGAKIESLLQYPEGSLEVSLSGYIVSLSDF